MHDHEPDFWSNLRNEVASSAQWIDRAVVLAYAAGTGLVVVGFTLLAEAASEGFQALRHWGDIGPWLLLLLWTPALTVGLLWWTRRFVPGAQGSGIPQVVLALDDETTEPQRRWLVSLLRSSSVCGSSKTASRTLGGLTEVSPRGVDPEGVEELLEGDLATEQAHELAIVGADLGGVANGAASAVWLGASSVRARGPPRDLSGQG